MLNSFRTILFDLDGTLTDSGPGIMKAASLVLDHYRIPWETSALRSFVGPPLSVSFEKWGVPEDEIDNAISIYRKHYHEGGLKFDNTPYPGICDLLQNLRSAGKTLYVATSKPERLSVEILEHFGMDTLFDEIAGASLDHSRENKNDVIRYLLDKAGANPSAAAQSSVLPSPPGEIVMVGDTVYDVTGAADLGLPCIGVSWGYGSAEDMKKAGALAIAGTMKELEQLLIQPFSVGYP